MWQIPKESVTNFVGNFFRCQLTLRVTNRANLWYSINTSRNVSDWMTIAFAKNQMNGCKTSLIVGSTGEARIADDVTNGIDVFLSRLVVFINNYSATFVDLNSNRLADFLSGVE